MLVLAIAGCGPTVTLDGNDGGTIASDSGAPGPTADESDGAVACAGAEALVQPGPAAMPSGFERCDTGVIHRVTPVACNFTGVESGGCTDEDPDAECASDADCVEMGPAYCIPPFEPWNRCECHQPCSTDADCEADRACYCDGPLSRCIPAECHVDSDCADGALCRLGETVTACGGITRRLACTSAADTCLVDAECEMCTQCLPFGEVGEWVCSASTGICGPCG